MGGPTLSLLLQQACADPGLAKLLAESDPHHQITMAHKVGIHLRRADIGRLPPKRLNALLHGSRKSIAQRIAHDPQCFAYLLDGWSSSQLRRRQLGSDGGNGRRDRELSELLRCYLRGGSWGHAWLVLGILAQRHNFDISALAERWGTPGADALLQAHRQIMNRTDPHPDSSPATDTPPRQPPAPPDEASDEAGAPIRALRRRCEALAEELERAAADLRRGEIGTVSVDTDTLDGLRRDASALEEELARALATCGGNGAPRGEGPLTVAHLEQLAGELEQARRRQALEQDLLDPARELLRGLLAVRFPDEGDLPRWTAHRARWQELLQRTESSPTAPETSAALEAVLAEESLEQRLARFVETPQDPSLAAALQPKMDALVLYYLGTGLFERRDEGEPGSGAEPRAQAETEAQPQPEFDVQLQPETENENQTESQAQPETEAETQPEAEPEPQLQPEAEAETQPEFDVQLQRETEAETQPQPQPETRLQSESQPEPQSEAEAESQAQPEAEAQPEFQLEPEAENPPEPSPRAEVQLQPENPPQAEVVARPEPKPNSVKHLPKTPLRPPELPPRQPVVLPPKATPEVTVSPSRDDYVALLRRANVDWAMLYALDAEADLDLEGLPGPHLLYLQGKLDWSLPPAKLAALYEREATVVADSASQADLWAMAVIAYACLIHLDWQQEYPALGWKCNSNLVLDPGIEVPHLQEFVAAPEGDFGLEYLQRGAPYVSSTRTLADETAQLVKESTAWVRDHFKPIKLAAPVISGPLRKRCGEELLDRLWIPLFSLLASLGPKMEPKLNRYLAQELEKAGKQRDALYFAFAHKLERQVHRHIAALKDTPAGKRQRAVQEYMDGIDTFCREELEGLAHRINDEEHLKVTYQDFEVVANWARRALDWYTTHGATLRRLATPRDEEHFRRCRAFRDGWNHHRTQMRAELDGLQGEAASWKPLLTPVLDYLDGHIV